MKPKFLWLGCDAQVLSLVGKTEETHPHKLVWSRRKPRAKRQKPNPSDHSVNQPPASAAWRMDGKWSANGYLLGSSSLANHGG